MLAKLTSKNRLTLPKAILSDFDCGQGLKSCLTVVLYRFA